MNLPRFYCPEISSPRTTLDEAEARHALHSLRLRPGDAVEVFDGRGTRATGRLVGPTEADPHIGKGTKAARRDVAVQIEQIESAPRPTRTLTLIVAGCKGPRLDWLVEKCTELGVTKLVFARFERSVVVPSKGHIEKLRRTAIEACKQCGRDWLPEFSTEAPVEEAASVERAVGAALFAADPAADATPITQALSASAAAQHRHFAAVVGPEGGLTSAELRSLVAAGGVPVRLGENILRIETAAVSIAAHWAAQVSV